MTLYLSVSVFKGKFEQPSQLGDTVNKEAAWKRLNPHLHCGQNKMKLKVMGPRAADLQLDTGIVTHPKLKQNLKAVKCLASAFAWHWIIHLSSPPPPGNKRTLPLIQVPETCGYSMKQNPLGLVLVVLYSGCSVIQEVRLHLWKMWLPKFSWYEVCDFFFFFFSGKELLVSVNGCNFNLQNVKLSWRENEILDAS